MQSFLAELLVSLKAEGCLGGQHACRVIVLTVITPGSKGWWLNFWPHQTLRESLWGQWLHGNAPLHGCSLWACGGGLLEFRAHPGLESVPEAPATQKHPALQVWSLKPGRLFGVFRLCHSLGKGSHGLGRGSGETPSLMSLALLYFST